MIPPPNDFSDLTGVKTDSRFSNFRAAQTGAPLLWSRLGNCLRVDWLELCGQRAPTCALLREQGALGLGKFIGVDTDPMAIESSREANGDEHAVWIVGDMLDLIADRDPRLDGVGVLNYDSFDGITDEGEQNLERLYSLFEFAERQREKISAFLLILNLANPRYRKVEKSAAALASLLREHTRRPWTTEDVMACRYRSKTVPMFNVHIKYGYLNLQPPITGEAP